MAASQQPADDQPVRSSEPRGPRLVSMPGSGARRPILFVNPLSDADFSRRAGELVENGARRPEEPADGLRPTYPNVVARKREISGEAESWYVYRDGHWVDDEPPHR